MRYKYYSNPEARTVVCVSTFAGKCVRGVAKCSPDDTFDEAKGTWLAKLRCDYKIAKKRQRRAKEKMEAASKALDKAEHHYYNMVEYYRDASVGVQFIEEDLDRLDHVL